jgi:hypothetical protein
MKQGFAKQEFKIAVELLPGYLEFMFLNRRKR